MDPVNNSARVIKPVSTVSGQILGDKHGPAMGFVNTIKGIAGDNSAASAKQAEELRRWQEEQARLSREYNRVEAQKNRDWQERMSNTAHQREVNDLVAAGLNPVLSAMGGTGAVVTSGSTASTSSPSGAKGDVDMSVGSVLGSILSSFLSLEGTRVNAEANQAIADKYTAMSKYTSELQAQTQLTTANISAMAQQYVAQLHFAGTKYAADQSAAASKVAASIHAAAQKYGYDVSSMTQKEIAAFNAEVNKDMQQAGFDQEFDIKAAYPGNFFQAMGSTFENIFGTGEGNGIQSVPSLWDSIFKMLDGRSSFSGKSVSGTGRR